MGTEVCDAGSLPGCLSDCSNSSIGYKCIKGNSTSPSVCAPVCGDGLLISPESCDDGGIGGCNSTCTGPN